MIGDVGEDERDDSLAQHLAGRDPGGTVRALEQLHRIRGVRDDANIGDE